MVYAKDATEFSCKRAEIVCNYSEHCGDGNYFDNFCQNCETYVWGPCQKLPHLTPSIKTNPVESAHNVAKHQQKNRKQDLAGILKTYKPCDQALNSIFIRSLYSKSKAQLMPWMKHCHVDKNTLNKIATLDEKRAFLEKKRRLFMLGPRRRSDYIVSTDGKLKISRLTTKKKP